MYFVAFYQVEGKESGLFEALPTLCIFYTFLTLHNPHNHPITTGTQQVL